MVLLYVPCESEVQAQTIAHDLLQKKLIACANIWPVTSMYLWQNSVEKETEFVLLAKTDKAIVDRAEEAIKDLHSYDTPCIIRIAAEANNEFREWMNNVLSIHL